MYGNFWVRGREAVSTKPRRFHRQIVISKRNSRCAEAELAEFGQRGVLGSLLALLHILSEIRLPPMTGAPSSLKCFFLATCALFRFTFINSEEFAGQLLANHNNHNNHHPQSWQIQHFKNFKKCAISCTTWKVNDRSPRLVSIKR